MSRQHLSMSYLALITPSFSVTLLQKALVIGLSGLLAQSVRTGAGIA
jgi:hypothetical protein